MICFYLITFLIGFLITKSFLKETKDKFLIFSFSVAFGITIETFIIFILMMLNLNNRIVFAFSEALLILAVITISVIKKTKYFSGHKNINKDKDRFLNVIFIISLLAGLIHVFYMIKTYPYGTWDAYYIWNMRPKFFIALQEVGESWKTFFSNIAEWTHPDYPLLIPIYNYKNHMLNGFYNPTLNTGTSVLIFFAVISGVYGLVNEISCRKNAILSAIILLTTSEFILLAVSQCADVPLSLFIIAAAASISLFVKYNNQIYVFFAYYFAASAAFCKNEGIMFFLIFTVINLLVIKNQSKKMIFYGAILPLTCVFLQKVLLSSRCDLFQNQTFDIIASKIFNPERYKIILFKVTKHFLEYFPIFIVIFCAACFSGFVKNNKLKNVSIMYISIIMLAIFGYFMIYLITPRELAWHIDTTDTRLMIHYLPLFIIFCFTAFNCANEKSALPNIEKK